MPTFEVDVEGKTYEVDAPDTNTAWAWAYTTHRQQFGMKPAAPPEKTGMLRAAADIPVQVGRGVAQGVKAFSDAFGSDNPVSRAASGVEGYLGELLSAQAQNNQAEISRIMKEAENKGVGAQVAAAAKAIATAPVDTISQVFGTAIPVIAGGLVGSLTRLGASAVGYGIGATMGAGTVKGSIYEAVKQELKANNVPEAEAERRAQEAQAYGGENIEQILLGAGLGAAASRGAERIITDLIKKGAMKPSALPAAARIPTAAVTEALPEAAQAAQERIAQNIALQREGYDVPTMRGVAGQAAFEGLAGAGLGAIAGAAQRTAPEAKVTKKAETPEGKVVGRTTVVTDEETAQRLREQQAAEPQQAEAEAPKPVTGEAGIVRPEEETPISREVAKAAEPEVAPPVAPKTAAPELAPPMPSAERATLEAVKPDALWNQFNDDPDQGRFLPFKKLTKGRQREWDAAVAAGTADMDTYLQIAGAQLGAEQAREKAKLDKILEASAATSRKRLVEAGVIEPSVTEVSPEPSITEDRQRAEPVAPVAEPVKPAAPIEAKRGSATRIIAGEEKIPAQWEVVEADSVKAAMTEGKTQPRDRKRAVSNAQIMSIAQNPDFDRLSDTSQTMDYGAPTLTQDGAIVGGNGRFEGVNLSYDTEAGQRYKQSLVENAERLGLDPEQVRGMQKPILVRRITQPADTRKLAIQSNIVAGLELSDMEQAALDAERMTGMDRLEISDNGDIPITSRNMDVLRSAFSDYTTEEMGKMMSADGTLSQSGLRRVKNAILYKAYGKTDTLARLIESPDADLKNVGTALMRASGIMSRMMDGIRKGEIAPEYDIVNELTGAIETLSALRASGTKVQTFLSQTELFEDGISDAARSLLRFMDGSLRSAKSITEFLNDYAQVVLSIAPSKGGLFEDVEPPAKQEIIGRAAEKYEAQRAAAKAQRTLEEQPSGEVRPEARVQPESEGRAAGSDEEVKKSLRATSAQQVADFEQTLRTALNKFGLKDVGVKLIDGMTEEGSYAQQLIRIAADSSNPIRTLRHEAIHALRELGFFTPQQWQSLSKMAKDKWIDQYLKQRNVDGKPLKAGEESRYDAYMRVYNGDMEKITEEAVADAFADFDATKPPSGLVSALLSRLRNLFQAIKSALTKVESPEQIFGKVERGELAAGAPEKGKEAKSLRDRATANFLRWFGDSKVVDEKGEPLVVYHWTDSDFTEFDMSRSGEGAHFGTKQAASDRARGMDTIGYEIEDEDGQYFVVADLGPKTDEWQGPFATKKDAISFRAQQPKKIEPMALYLSINNPIRLPDLGTWSVWDIVRELPKGTLSESDRAAIMDANDRYAKLRETLLNKGIDGFVYRNEVEDKGNDSYIAFSPTQIKSAFGNNGEYSLTDADIRKSLRKPGEPSPTTAGQSALDTINQLGMGVKEPEKNLYQKAKDTFKQMGESPAGTKEEIKEAVRKFFANTESKVFSPDARWDSDIKNGLRKDMKPVEEIIGASLLVSQSQAVGPDGVATRAMLIGGAKYDAEVMKWVAYENKDANEIVKAKVLDDIAAKYGLTREEASQVAHTYLVAANYEGILKRNAKLEQRIKELQQEGKKDEADDLQAALVFVSEDQAAMVEPGKAIADSIPEVKKITEIWNEQRRMVKDAMVFGGLWTPEYADALMDNAAYVPFYREKQIEADEGPRVFMRGLQVKAKEQKLKGSKTAVNDVFENMALWQQYAINRAIRNHKMVQSIDVGKTIQVGDRKMAEQVSEPKRGMNVVRLWREGKQEFYEVADPYYVEAFQSLGAVYIEPIKYFTAISNILRKTVVMYPLFSLGQLTQDSVAAIFASGLKPQYALKIPFLAVQEFIKTMKGWSTTHNELANYGAVGVRDFNANVAKEDAEITANIKAPKGTAGKIKYMLERIAMSADNAVRQATYIASQDAGLSKAEALEKAFEIINFRRRGSSKLLQLMGQTVPFFYAYLSAQRVAYKTLTLSGISPTERMAALETLAQTTAAVMALSFLYAMANGDDEEYKKTPATVRDRSLIIPGSGGVRIPLRPDFFLFPKVIAEHTYQLITDEGYSDGAKFRKSMADLFANATLSPNVVPQIVKPTFEAAINYSFFEGKPIIGYFEQNKEAGRQFNESTSEFAKWLGRFGASPQMVDHLVRGYFGSVGGLGLWGTNFFIEGEPGVPRPELTAHDMLTTMPGVGAFKQKSSENALKVDFYELRDAIAKAKNTYDDMKVRSPEGLEAFLQDEKNLARLAMDKQVTKIGDHLSKIRRAIQQVAAAPADRMSASEKQERIKELRDVEMELLKAVDVKAMRAQAKL